MVIITDDVACGDWLGIDLELICSRGGSRRGGLVLKGRRRETLRCFFVRFNEDKQSEQRFFIVQVFRLTFGIINYCSRHGLLGCVTCVKLSEPEGRLKHCG